jgi:hypothetical protein
LSRVRFPWREATTDGSLISPLGTPFDFLSFGKCSSTYP